MALLEPVLAVANTCSSDGVSLVLAGVDHGKSVLDHEFRTGYGLGKRPLRRRRRNLGHTCLIRDKILLNSSVRQPTEMLK